MGSVILGDEPIQFVKAPVIFESEHKPIDHRAQAAITAKHPQVDSNRCISDSRLGSAYAT